MTPEQWKTRRDRLIKKQGYMTNVTPVGGKQKQTKLYATYRLMIQRCTNPNRAGYEYYGGKGVEVRFENYAEFRAWALANGFAKGLTIDRINPDGHYEPENCRWATLADNVRHAVTTRDNSYLLNRERDCLGRFA